MKPVNKSFGVVGCAVFGSVLFAAVGAQASIVSPIISPIYGNDDRQDLYQVTDPMLLRLADSTVALIESDSLVLDASGTVYNELGMSLGDSHNVCASEPFVNQKTLAFCSGALVAPDLVITAGHCITNMDDCTGAKIAFGFSLPQSAISTDTFQASEVYQCADIVSRAKDEGGADYAVIRLDRAVKGHTPLEIERNSTLAVGTPLAVIGHPDGLPAKVAGGAFVRENSDPFKFVANLDTYHGNSGSPVFNTRTGKIEGILVEGENDYDMDEAAGCYVNKRCKDDSCMGERSTRISYAAPFIPAPVPPVVVPVPARKPVFALQPRVVAPTPAPARTQPRVTRRRSLFRRIFGH